MNGMQAAGNLMAHVNDAQARITAHAIGDSLGSLPLVSVRYVK
jgi:hypothetical protein